MLMYHDVLVVHVDCQLRRRRMPMLLLPPLFSFSSSFAWTMSSVVGLMEALLLLASTSCARER